MARKHAAVLILTLFALALWPGCAAPGGGGGGQASTSQGQGTAGELYPGPIVTPPEIYGVEIQENRNHNPIHPDIIVAYRGGKGQVFLKRILVTVVRSDGQVISKSIDQPASGQISVGDSVTITGTTGVDRVIAVASILGKDYKILDMMDDYNSHP